MSRRGGGRHAQLVVLAKQPLPGRAKTRLTPPYSPEDAAALAQGALEDTLRAAAAVPVRRVVLAIDGDRGVAGLGSGTDVRGQRGGSLGERIGNAMTDAWAEAAVPVLLIGMDTPQVTAEQLTGAVDALLSPDTDAVVGPAVDGGFWALGLRRPRVEYVEPVPMSRPDTCARLLAVLAAHGLRVRRLDELRDVDLAGDVPAVAGAAPCGAFAAVARRLGTVVA